VPIRVALAGTGNAGRLALVHLLTDRRFELTGVWVHSPERAGQDAGGLAGLDVTTGVRATDDWDALLAGAPDCVVYCAMGDNRLRESIADLRRVLSAGVNVVGTAPTPLVFPWGSLADKHLGPLEAAAREGNASLFVSGVDPGFANDLIPLALAGTCRRVEQIRCTEIADYATYDGAIVMFEVLGFGAPLEKTPWLLLPGMLSRAWGPTIRQLAAGLGIELDEITEWYEQEPAPESFDIAAGPIPAGGVAGLRFEIRGMSGGKPVLVLEHVTRLRDDLRPDWLRPAQPGGSYRVEITGEPSYTLDICPTSEQGDHNHAAILAGVGRVVNAIPAVIAAPAGIRTTLDLPLITGPGLTPRPEADQSPTRRS
jgi:2,4-diaminopentanoate dehydrogenase